MQRSTAPGVTPGGEGFLRNRASVRAGRDGGEGCRPLGLLGRDERQILDNLSAHLLLGPGREPEGESTEEDEGRSYEAWEHVSSVPCRPAGQTSRKAVERAAGGYHLTPPGGSTP